MIDDLIARCILMQNNGGDGVVLGQAWSSREQYETFVHLLNVLYGLPPSKDGTGESKRLVQAVIYKLVNGMNEPLGAYIKSTYQKYCAPQTIIKVSSSLEKGKQNVRLENRNERLGSPDSTERRENPPAAGSSSVSAVSDCHCDGQT